MEDQRIIDLFWERSEQAVRETERKYGDYCFCISMRILQNFEDAKEIVNDTMFAAWGNIPPERPGVLRTYLGKIARNLSLKRWRDKNVKKRGGGEVALALEEMTECVSDHREISEEIERKELIKLIEIFLREQKEFDRQVFLSRYFYFEPVKEISRKFGCSESKVKSVLFRMRKKLEKRLNKEGYFL